MNRRMGMAGAVALVASLLLGAPAAHAEEPEPAPAPTTGTIYVPSGLDLSQTRATGHVELEGTALHIWTEGTTSTDKAAGYVRTSTPLTDVDSPVLHYSDTDGAGKVPGYQLVVDFDGNGTADGILVGEPAYDGRWWLAGASKAFDWSAAPKAADGYDHSADLDAWNAAYPQATVSAYGFSLGSGVKGDGILSAIDFAGTRYTFAADVVLSTKDQCKNGGWATSTVPVYENQGQCVSHFATTTKKGNAPAGASSAPATSAGATTRADAGTSVGAGTTTGTGTPTTALPKSVKAKAI